MIMLLLSRPKEGEIVLIADEKPLRNVQLIHLLPARLAEALAEVAGGPEGGEGPVGEAFSVAAQSLALREQCSAV